MGYKIDAAAGCDKGRIRQKNEDNLYFNGQILPEEHDGLKYPVEKSFDLNDRPLFAVFDGMGGEAAGETASWTAASAADQFVKEHTAYLESPGDYLRGLCQIANEAVCTACDELEEERMGSTLVSLLFTPDEVYCCNLGDSRAFRYRENSFQQLSKDHVMLMPPESKRKAPLSQYLGIYPEELTLVPYIAKGDLQAGDLYLICSDGITDMLKNIEICNILREEENVRLCVEKLIEAAKEKGGRDNITAVLCRVE